jgi:hypothetical protein
MKATIVPAKSLQSPIRAMRAPAAILQRKCACGGNPGPSGECEECRKKRLAGPGKGIGMQAKLAVNQPGDRWEREADQMAENVVARRPAMPVQPAPTQIHRVETSSSAVEAPASVQDGLKSPGQPLDSGTRALMGSHFGYDFGSVRVHADRRAAEAAQDVNALAFTVGQDLVFAPGQYAPQTQSGQKLLAHELTHVIQQSQPSIGGTLQRQASPIDAAAQAIIDAAADGSVAMATRAPDVVQRIINQYFPADASKIGSIVYNQATIGLSTTYTGPGATLTGIITVGDQFVTGTTRSGISRRVAQVGHEIEHVGQQRAGMGGANRSDEREFLAFYHEALFVEKPGTGRIQHAMRVTLIDGALGYYYCLSAALQTQYDSNKQELLTRRATESTAGGNTPTPAPTTCRRQ